MADGLFGRRFSRRGALRLAGGAGLLSTIGTVLAACGGGQAAATTAPAPAATKAGGAAQATPTTAAKAAAASGGPREKLTVWTDATFAPPSDDYQTKAMEDWAKANNADIEITREPGDQVAKKLQAAIESKQFPDLSQVDGGRFTLHRDKDVFLDVSDLYKEVGTPWGGFYKVAEQQATYKGKQGFLPYSIDSSLILYRKDILDGASLPAPKTWQDLFDQAAKLQKPPELYGVGFQLNPAGTDAESTYYHMALSFGAMPVSQDGKTATFDSSQMLEFVNFFKAQWARGVFPPGVTGWDNAANNVNFQEERIVFINNPASPIVWAKKEKPEFLPKIGVAAMPAGPSGKGYTSAYVRDGWGLFKSTPEKRQALAKGLLRHLYSKEIYSKWMELAFPSPAVQGMENLDIWKDPRRGGFLEAAKTGILGGYPGEPTTAWSEFGSGTPYIKMLSRVIVDKWEPKKAIEEQAKQMQEIYAKHK